MGHWMGSSSPALRGSSSCQTKLAPEQNIPGNKPSQNPEEVNRGSHLQEGPADLPPQMCRGT